MVHADRKILCIEDDRETAGLIAEELVDRGFQVSLAHSGQEGLMAIMRATPDLVLCDVSMPNMSGFEVLERLNEIAPRLGHIPFVFLTALADRDQRTAGAAARCRRLCEQTHRFRSACVHHRGANYWRRADQTVAKTRTA